MSLDNDHHFDWSENSSINSIFIENHFSVTLGLCCRIILAGERWDLTRVGDDFSTSILLI